MNGPGQRGPSPGLRIRAAGTMARVSLQVPRRAVPGSVSGCPASHGPAIVKLLPPVPGNGDRASHVGLIVDQAGWSGD